MGITISGGLNIGSGLTVPASPSDPYFENVTLLLPGNGSNNSTNNTFTDSSTNNFAITRNGNTTQGTFSPFSQTGWSNYFDGTGDYFTVPYSANFNLSSGDWTMEAWFNANSFASGMIIIAKDTYGVNYDWSMLIGSSTSISLYTQRTAVNLTVTVPAMSVGVWYHVAFVRSGSTNTIYLNGVSYGSNTMTISNESLTTPTIGCAGYNNPGGFMNGYISNLRVVKGTAVYTSNFTPTTAPLTAISGTSLLTCQSNRLLDASTNNLTITKYGDVSVQAFSPFNPPLSYTPATVGGSGYFDGSGDYLSLTNSNLYPSTSTTPFTLEALVYPMATSGGYIISNAVATNSVKYCFMLGTSPDNSSGTKVVFGRFTGSWSYLASATSISTYSWTHIACVFTGSTCQIYINGTLDASGGPTTWNTGGSNELRVGYRWDEYAPGAPFYFTGYLSGVRVTPGSAVYSAAFTPPTAPLTPIANTSLLLNFTNSSIVDASAKNILETTTGAQISTAQYKWNGSSILIDNADRLGTKKLVFRNNYSLDFGTGDFTIEAWIYLINLSTGNNQAIIASGYGGVIFVVQYTTNVLLIANYGGNSIAGSTALSAGQWYHVAATRNSGTTRLFLNGTVTVTSSTSLGSLATSSNINVGQDPVQNLDQGFNGYIQDLRITKGVARYTANFTAPTAPFPTY